MMFRWPPSRLSARDAKLGLADSTNSCLRIEAGGSVGRRRAVQRFGRDCSPLVAPPANRWSGRALEPVLHVDRSSRPTRSPRQLEERSRLFPPSQRRCNWVVVFSRSRTGVGRRQALSPLTSAALRPVGEAFRSRRLGAGTAQLARRRGKPADRQGCAPASGARSDRR
jgi:hypothetical protein